ncbi:biotin synthase auxiliary protein BsaP [Saccharomonospora halophila]|uniref:biotin synthase auxiliary protein BsaP n=1 Tax=Saccharomonospora halophila TaxID=129922 RepID=UPI00036E5CC1
MRYCAHCGRPETAGSPGTAGVPNAAAGTEGPVDHTACRGARPTLEPPRFCVECARRMVVQITPAGWSARCSRHGETTSADVSPTG